MIETRAPGGGFKRGDLGVMMPVFESVVEAGGLTPENVSAVVQQLNPAGVDVASGTATPDGVRKDAQKCQLFVANARQAQLSIS